VLLELSRAAENADHGPGRAGGQLGIEVTSFNHAALELIDRASLHLGRGALGFRNERHCAYVYHSPKSWETRRFFHTCLADFFKATSNEQDFQQTLDSAKITTVKGRIFRTYGLRVDRGTSQRLAEAVDNSISGQHTW